MNISPASNQRFPGRGAGVENMIHEMAGEVLLFSSSKEHSEFTKPGGFSCSRPREPHPNSQPTKGHSVLKKTIFLLKLYNIFFPKEC